MLALQDSWEESSRHFHEILARFAQAGAGGARTETAALHAPLQAQRDSAGWRGAGISGGEDRSSEFAVPLESGRIHQRPPLNRASEKISR